MNAIMKKEKEGPVRYRESRRLKNQGKPDTRESLEGKKDQPIPALGNVKQG